MNSNVQECVWFTWWFLFSVRYSRIYRVYHKKHETLCTNLPIHNYFNRINNRLMFQIKDAFKLELQAPKAMKIFATSYKLIDKTKSR